MLPFERLYAPVRAWLHRALPEHQIYFRSQGQVRFVRVSTRIQVAGVVALTLVTGWMSSTMIAYYVRSDVVMSKERELAAKEQQLAALKREIAAMSRTVNTARGSAEQFAARIEQRQQFMEELLGSAGKTPKESKKSQEAAYLDSLPGSANGMIAQFKAVEAKQLVFAQNASVAARSRYMDREALLRRLGLRASHLVKQSAPALGGPFVDAQAVLGRLEPQLRDFFAAWSKLERLDKAMVSIPSFIPVARYTVTSGFGVRYDPFTGRTAMHQGIDLSSGHGEAIYAAADGVVQRAASTGAYGNMVDLDHDRGLGTRYGHLSKILVRTGQRVTQGQKIGMMGSTGRSTGTHLHYEVRIDGRAVNPMPFLEASADVLEIQRRARERLEADQHG